MNSRRSNSPLRSFKRVFTRVPLLWFSAALLLACHPCQMHAQATPQSGATQTAPSQSAPVSADQAKQPRESDRRRAAKLYLAASKLFMEERYEDAIRDYDQAATLDPTNADYRLSGEIARNHAVTAFIQAAAKDRLRGDAESARAALARALQLDPRNVEATQHLYELGDDVARAQTSSLYAQGAGDATGIPQLLPAAGTHSFHLRTDQRLLIQQVFKAYGIIAATDNSIQSRLVRFDIDNVTFDEATRALALITNSFYVDLDAHRALVAADTRDNRLQFTRQQTETIYLSGLTPEEMTEVTNLGKQVFDLQQIVAQPGTDTITIRGAEDKIEAFNSTVRSLIDGHSQVLLDVRLIQIAHTSDRNTGVQPPQTFTAFNVYAQEQSILNANQALVQQIVSSGLAAPGDTLAILGILLASGQVSSSLFQNGIALFGGGLTQSALSPGATTLNFALNSSDSRELDQIQLRLADGQPGTLKEGEKYPIQTSSFSSLSASVPNIPGLTGAGASGSLSSLLSSLQGSVPSVPQVQYQDLGFTLKATPNVMRNDMVALTIDLQITALAGSSINGNPVLNNRSYSGVITIKQGEGVVVASEIDKSESNNISGTPGLSEIPGLNNITEKDVQKNYATLLVIITPHVVRGTQSAGHSGRMRVERSSQQP